MRRVVGSSLALAGVLVVAAAAAIGWGFDRFGEPGPLRDATTVVLPAGIGVNEISRRLRAAGVIERPLLFRVAVRVSGRSRDLRAGEYAFAAAVSPGEVLELLVAGRTVVRRVTVPEGLTSRQVVALLHVTPGLVGAIAQIPEEGTLLPETYHFSLGDERAAMLARMRAALRDVLADLWLGRDDGLPYATPEEALVLASIVEKETGAAAERARVAGVFVNRLRRGMRLQSDPTVAYALSGGRGPLKRALTRADLTLDSPLQHLSRQGTAADPDRQPGTRGDRRGDGAHGHHRPLLRRRRPRRARLRRHPARPSAQRRQAAPPAAVAPPVAAWRRASRRSTRRGQAGILVAVRRLRGHRRASCRFPA